MGEDDTSEGAGWHLPEEDGGEFDETELESAMLAHRKSEYAALADLD